MKYSVLTALLMIAFSTVSYAHNMRKVTCDISFQTDYAPIDFFNGFQRKNYNLSESVVTEIPVTSSPEAHTLVYETEHLYEFFRRRIKFMANITVDPTTGKDKLFIGMYEVFGEYYAPSYTTYLDRLMYLINDVKIKDYNGNYRDSRDVYLPIGSAVSDSGSVEVFNGKYGEAYNNRLKFNCQILDGDNYVSEFEPSKRPRERFSCNIKVKKLNSSKTPIDEINKRVTLGFMYSNKRDLQPIIEDDHFDGLMLNARIMGNLFVDPIDNKPKFLLGIYLGCGVRYCSDKMYADYKIHETIEPGVVYYIPKVESISESDYIEIRSTVGSAYNYSIKAECKKTNNSTVWLDKILN